MRPDVQMLDLLVQALLDVRDRLDPVNQKRMDVRMSEVLNQRAANAAKANAKAAA